MITTQLVNHEHLILCNYRKGQSLHRKTEMESIEFKCQNVSLKGTPIDPKIADLLFRPLS